MSVVGTEREATAYHEAGHGVIDVLTGQRFRYITLRPKDGNAGHVMSAQWSNPCRWLDETATMFGGMIAEDLYLNEGCSRASDLVTSRRVLTEVASTDLKLVRWVTGSAWRYHHTDPTYRPATPIAPGWTPLEMAKAGWERAVWLLAASVEAVGELATALLDSRRAITWVQAREIVYGCEPMAVSAAESVQHDMLRPWFLDHSRLKWAPPKLPSTNGSQADLAAARKR